MPCATLITESRCGSVLAPTGWTPWDQLCAALITKFRLSSVGMLTLRTLHTALLVTIRGNGYRITYLASALFQDMCAMSS
jgi:hypothetical protein